MRHSKVLTVLTASVLLAVTGCSGADDAGYLGSRDDIIVKNRNMPGAPVADQAAVPAPAATVEGEAVAAATPVAETPVAAAPVVDPAEVARQEVIDQVYAENDEKIAALQGATVEEEMKAAEADAMAPMSVTQTPTPSSTPAPTVAPTGSMSAHDPVTTLEPKVSSAPTMSQTTMAAPSEFKQATPPVVAPTEQMTTPTSAPDSESTVGALKADEHLAPTPDPYPPMGHTAMLPPAGMVLETPAAVAAAPTSENVPPLPTGYQGEVPLNAKPGECYAKVLTPAVVETTKEKVQVSEEQQVLARIVPAKYEVTKEKVLIKEARQYWKQGRGLNEKVDQTTGEILCLVEEPAEYKVIEKRTLTAPEKPEYQTQPAQFEDVTKTKVVEPAHMEWQRVLCETNINEATIMRVQKALEAAGFAVGKVDGKIGNMTMAALRAYQAKNKLPVGNLSYDTLKHLGVSPAGA